jgi:hypothetical protein
MLKRVEGLGQNGVWEGRCSVYIATCGAYSDLWPGFFHCWQKYWPDCPFPIYLGADKPVLSRDQLVQLPELRHAPWSEQVRSHLEQIPTDYVLLVLDDFYLRRSVETVRILTLLNALISLKGAMLRLLPRPPPDILVEHKLMIGECLDGGPYRVCTQASLWQREALIALLRPSESIWEFEQNVQVRAAATHDRYYCVTDRPFPYQGLIFHHVVEKGNWIPCEYFRCRLNNVPCRDSTRPLMALRGFSLLLLAETINRILTIAFGPRAAKIRGTLKRLLPRSILKKYRKGRKYADAS